MKDTIEHLWYGRITPCQICGENSPEIKELSNLIERNKESLEAGLSAQQNERLKILLSCCEEYTDLFMLQAFIDGFGLQVSY